MQPEDGSSTTATVAAPSAPTTTAPPEPPPAPSPGPLPVPPAEPSTPPEPTGPPPQTPDPDLPDHGADPDKGIDPDKGDQPPADAATTEEETPADGDQSGDNVVDFSKMSRAERRDYYQELNSKKQAEIAQAVDAVYQPENESDLVTQFKEEGYTDFEAGMLARDKVREEQAQIDRAKAQIGELNNMLTVDAVEVTAAYPWVNPAKNGEYDKLAANAASELYEATCLTKDPRTNQYVEARMTPKQFYGLIDKIRSSGTTQAGVQAQKAAERQMAAVAPPTSSHVAAAEPAFADLPPEKQAEILRAKGHEF